MSFPGRVTRRVGLGLAVATSAGVMAITSVGVAWAADNHAIHGTVYSPCSSHGHVWYTSDNDRYKEGEGKVKAKFNDLIPGGLKFRIIDSHNSVIGHSQSWEETETDEWKTFAKGVNDGKKFFNAFKQVSSSCGQGDYHFEGTEKY